MTKYTRSERSGPPTGVSLQEFGAWLQGWGAFMLHQVQHDASAPDAPPAHWRALTAVSDPPDHWLALLREHGVEWPPVDAEPTETAVSPAQPWTLDGQPLADVPPATWLRWFMAGFHDFVLALAGPEAVTAVFGHDRELLLPDEAEALPGQLPAVAAPPGAPPAQHSFTDPPAPPPAATPTPDASSHAAVTPNVRPAVVQLRRPAAAPPLADRQAAPESATAPASPPSPAQPTDAAPQAPSLPARSPGLTDAVPAAPASSPTTAAEMPRVIPSSAAAAPFAKADLAAPRTEVAQPAPSDAAPRVSQLRLAQRPALDQVVAPEATGARAAERKTGTAEIQVGLPLSPNRPAPPAESSVVSPSPSVTVPVQRPQNPAHSQPTSHRETASAPSAPADVQAPATGDRPIARLEPSPLPPPDSSVHSPSARAGEMQLPGLEPRPVADTALLPRPFIAQLDLSGVQERETAVSPPSPSTPGAARSAPRRTAVALELPGANRPPAPDAEAVSRLPAIDPRADRAPQNPQPSASQRPTAPQQSRTPPARPIPAAPVRAEQSAAQRSQAPAAPRLEPKVTVQPLQIPPSPTRAVAEKPPTAPEDRSWTWPELPPAPQVDNPGYHYRHDPARRRRLAREQRGS